MAVACQVEIEAIIKVKIVQSFKVTFHQTGKSETSIVKDGAFDQVFDKFVRISNKLTRSRKASDYFHVESLVMTLLDLS